MDMQESMVEQTVLCLNAGSQQKIPAWPGVLKNNCPLVSEAAAISFTARRIQE